MRKSALLIFVFFLFLIFHFSSFISPAFAQANTNPDVPNNLHNWTQNVMIEVMSALTCQLAGVDPINPKQGCLGIDSSSGKIGFLPQSPAPNGAGGAIGFMGNIIATLYTPPFHTADYFQNLASNFGINKNAYAQSTGTGFQGLTPLIGIWSAFRNIVYLFLVIIFVVIGLAIMLRVKIDPRTVMSIQNQIPKIIIGILVVTFSFAIAGFLIDMMWVFIYLIYGIFSGISPEIAKHISGLNPVAIQGSNPFGALGALNILSIVWNASLGVGGIIASILGGGGGDGGIGYGAGGGAVGAALGALGFLLNPIVGILTIILGATALAGVGNTVGLIGGILAFVIILIAVLVALFRLWFTLIIAYVHILIDVVLAPFWIIGGIVPGSPISLSGWLRDLIANLAAFPAVIGLFLLGKVFMKAFGTKVEGQFVPPLIGNPGDTSTIGALIGLGIILMAPNVVNMLKTALKAPKVDTGGAFKAIGVGAALPIKSIQSAAGIYGASKYDISGRETPEGRVGRIFQRFFR